MKRKATTYDKTGAVGNDEGALVGEQVGRQARVLKPDRPRQVRPLVRRLPEHLEQDEDVFTLHLRLQLLFRYRLQHSPPPLTLA